MSVPTQPLEVKDFTGGITDYFIGGRMDQAETMDNLFLNPNKEPFTRWGSEAFIESQIPTGIFRISKLSFLDDGILAFAQRRCYDGSSGSWVDLVGPSSLPPFDLGDANSIITDAEWQGHLFLSNDAYASVQKIYTDDAGDLQLRNAGLPSFNTTGVSIVPAGGSSDSYLYAFCYKYTYKVGDVTFIDRGPVYQFPSVVSSDPIDAGQTVTVNLSTTLTAVENWDAVNIEIEIYRTQNGEQDFFLLTTESLGTASYIDNNEDADILTNLGLYTNGGASKSNDTPPRCKFIHVVNDLAYYANLQTGADDDAYLIRQSIPGDVDSVPASFFARAEQKIVAVSSIFDRPLVLCEKFVYRIDNIITAAGAGSMDLRRIDDRAGCVSQNSIVQTHKGVFWAGEVGFYWSDGFRVMKISDQLNDTYKLFTANDERKKRIQGTYEPSNERIIWSVCKEDGANEPDMCMVLDLKWRFNGQQPASNELCFTTMSGGDYFRPTSLAVNDNKIYRGDTRGFVLEHAPNYFTDPKIDTSKACGS